MRDAELIERQHSIDDLRAERLSLQERLAQFRHKLNQISTNQHSNTQTTPTTNLVYMSKEETTGTHNQLG